ncbi:MAG: hypothetical protein ACXACC_07125 [Promethearchaeota archaeon]|jgi:hypothetical protein
MNKTDYLYMILDNILVFNINLPPEFQGNGLNGHLNKFDEYGLKVIAGFNKNFLEHFLRISMGKTQNDIKDALKKMEKISYMVGPIGNLNYLTPEQVDHILTKIQTLKFEEINEEKIGLVADDLLREQFGAPGNYSAADALENQLSSAAFYLMNMGYSREEIQEKFNEVRRHPSKLGELFTLPQKEIYSIPTEIEQSSTVSPPSNSESEAENNQGINDVIARHVQSIHQDITEEKAQKVDEILQEIKAHVKDSMSELQEKVFRQMHPDRLKRALKMLRTTKRKSKRMQLYLEWFSESFLLSKIELKVEHWQVSSSAGHGSAGVYTAGIDFSRYDNIIREFPDNKLTKVVNITRKILQNPTKKAIQKLGQDLIAETGFDEHLYFTD